MWTVNGWDDYGFEYDLYDSFSNWFDLNENKKEDNMRIEGEQKYFSAEEAREITDSINSDKLKDELDWIYKKIDVARFNGEHSITFSDKTLLNVTKEFLKSKGFKVSHFSGCQWDSADDTTISW